MSGNEWVLDCVEFCRLLGISGVLRTRAYEDVHTRMGIIKEENYSGDTRMARLIRVWNFGKRKIALVIRVWQADMRMGWFLGHFMFWWNAYDTRMRRVETRMDAYGPYDTRMACCV